MNLFIVFAARNAAFVKALTEQQVEEYVDTVKTDRLNWLSTFTVGRNVMGLRDMSRAQVIELVETMPGYDVFSGMSECVFVVTQHPMSRDHYRTGRCDLEMVDSALLIERHISSTAIYTGLMRTQLEPAKAREFRAKARKIDVVQ